VLTGIEKTLRHLSDSITAAKLMRSGKLNGIPSKGRLNFFFYDPKYKRVLPLYDSSHLFYLWKQFQVDLWE